MSDAERAIPATPRRRAAAREQGAAPNAALPAFVAMTAAAMLLLPTWAATAVPAAAAAMRAAITAAFSPAGDLARTSAVDPAALPLGVVAPTAALVLAVAGVGLAVRFLLDGSAWRLSRALPQFRRLDPRAGFARVFSLGTFRAVAWNGVCLATIAAVGAVAAAPLVRLLTSAEPLVDADRALAALRGGLMPVVAAAAAVAAAQWGLARLAFERRIRMTPEELKEELRGLEADPRIRSERQRLAGRR